LDRWRYFSQLLDVQGVNDVRQTEIHTAEPPVPEPSTFEVEIATESQKDKNHQELIRPRGRTILCEIRKLTDCIWNKEELPEEWKESILAPIYKKVDKDILVIIEAYHFANLVHKFIQNSAVKVNSICRGNYCGSSVWILTQQVKHCSYFYCCTVHSEIYIVHSPTNTLFIKLRKV
jgi:hypothetical protein